MSFTGINASEPPEGTLIKEVYAHFGLCMYLSQVFETGLINLLTAVETAASEVPSRQAFDRLYGQHELFTFGKLISAISLRGLLPDELIKEVRNLKSARDHLAHRFFRDHDLDFLTVGGCYLMIERLEGLQGRFHALDKKVSEFEIPAFERIGITKEQFRTQTKEIMDDMLKEAAARYSSSLGGEKSE